jgi:acyl-CoA thioester hydrolase
LLQEKTPFTNFELKYTSNLFPKMLSFNHSIKVRYVETDAMQRVHHSNHLIWFEECRIELLNHMGIPYDQLEASGFLIPVISAHIEYLKPASFNQSLAIAIELKNKPKVRFKFDYTISHKEDLIAKGQTEHTFINQNNKVVRPPEIFNQAVDQHWQSDKD